jgi:hypothetical protein
MSLSPETRRLIAKLVLLLGLIWVLFWAAGPFSPVRLIPGCAFLPAAYYAIRLHRGDDSDRSWHFMAIYVVAGVVMMIASSRALAFSPIL